MMNHALTRSASPAADPFWSLVDRFFNEGAQGERSGSVAPVHRSWMPPVDIYETEDAFTATADLPGLKKDDIDISLEDNTLTVSGERTWGSDDENGTFRRVERAHGKFSRSFSLPSGIDVTKLDASFKDGVLTLTMPKSEMAKVRKITVS